MDARIEKIMKAFLENGWKMIGPVDISSDWWFDEIFLIESQWSPVGKKLYLTLLTDPMEIRRKEVWSVSVSSSLPENRHIKPIGQITLNDVKKIDLKSFVKLINDLILN